MNGWNIVVAEHDKVVDKRKQEVEKWMERVWVRSE